MRTFIVIMILVLVALASCIGQKRHCTVEGAVDVSSSGKLECQRDSGDGELYWVRTVQ